MRLKYVMTTFPANVETVAEGEAEFVADPGIENQVINLYPGVEYQELEGFGGAFTESAAYVYSKMDEESRKDLLGFCFSEEGMGYTLARMHLDSCDFSLSQYEAMGDPEDKDLESFSLERMERYILPFFQDAEEYSGRKLEVMVSPWSPPAFMKTNGERSHGGKLRKERRELWARYLCRYITELRKRGVDVRRLSVQNEPAAVQAWDSCVYTASEEKEFLRDYLHPALLSSALGDVEVYIWDHNKERAFERALDTIDEDTDKLISGIAVHWYSGDHFEALQLLHDRFPDKKILFSEACIEYYKFDPSNVLGSAQKYAHDMIGDFNSGMTSFYDWNLVLDSQGGPNHVRNYCDAPFMYDMGKGELVKRPAASYLWHFSHFLRPGARRIGKSVYTSDLEVTAFRNPGGDVAAIVLNRTKEDRKAVIRLSGQVCPVECPADSILTLVVAI